MASWIKNFAKAKSCTFRTKIKGFCIFNFALNSPKRRNFQS